MKWLQSKSALACVLILLLGAANVALGVGIKPTVLKPSNDDCDEAKPVSDITDMAFNTTHATFDGPGHYINSPNIWYCYTATCNGCATVTLAGSSFDTKLAAYDGCGCYPSLEDLIKSNDDFHGQQSQITFPVKAGGQYLIEVGGFNPSVKGRGVISISCDSQSTQPTNDDCSDATQVGNVTEQPFDTTCATFDGPGLFFSSPNLWYRYTAGGTGEVTVSLIGSEYDTALIVYDGGGCYPKQEDIIERNDDFGSYLQSQITFQATAGNDYLIEVMGYNSDEVGQGVITISSVGVSPPSGSNDNLAHPQPINDVTDLPFDTTSATQDGPHHCMYSPNIWFCYTATCTGEVRASLAGSSFDTMLAVYDGCKCYPTFNDLIECNDDTANSYQSAVTFAAVAGSRYLIEVGGYANDKGPGLLTVNCQGAVAQNKPDLGDAPDSTNNFGKAMMAYPTQGLLQVIVNGQYPTVYNDGSGTGPFGPVHLNEQTVAFLGNKITRETEADTGPDEDGVNNLTPSNNTPDRDQGDDGVVFPISMPNCRYTTFDYIVNVVDPGTDLWVNVWLDFNRDGDWDDTLECPAGPVPEWAVQNQFLFNLPAGLNQITTPAFLPLRQVNAREDIWMRITLSGQPYRGGSNPGVRGNAGSGPQAKYAIGETEDYHFTPDVTATICEDFNGDGVIDINDLADLVSEWLEICP